jgi:hypothetical protein
LGTQLILRKNLLQEASNNPNILALAQNKRIESVRDEMQQKLDGSQSLKKTLLDLERIKKEERDLSQEVTKRLAYQEKQQI